MEKPRRRIYECSRRRFLILICLPAAYYVLAAAATRVGLLEPHGHRSTLMTGPARRLLQDIPQENCTPPAIYDFPGGIFSSKELREGAIVLHFVCLAYLFTLLALVCDEYFVPSIKLLSARMNLAEDVAGATFMAVATSSPELFINIVGTFVTEGDIGVGTVVGSAVFNVLAVPACCGLFAGKVVALEAWPLTRDCLMYGVTVVLLIAAIYDGMVFWYESLILVTVYLIYVAVMCNNKKLKSIAKKFCICLRRPRLYQEEETPKETTPLLKDRDIEQQRKANADGQREPEDHQETINVSVEHQDCQKGKGGNIPHDSERQAAANGKLLEECQSISKEKLLLDDYNLDDRKLCEAPITPQAVFFWPVRTLLALTIPDCRQQRWRRYFGLTLSMCVLWIGTTSYMVAWMITVIGDTLGIPDSVMGLTLLAAGTSLPEAVSSVIVTNQGHGTMGISNSIGSNTFDILLCLGLPWLLKATFLPMVPGEHVVSINSGGLLYSAISLLSTLLMLYTAFAVNNFKLNRAVGCVTLFIYVGFLGFSTTVELNMFGEVNLPTCPH